MLKNKKVLIVSFMVLLVIIIATLILTLCFPKSKYDDKLILGKNVSSIIDTYGEFDCTRRARDGTIDAGWYIIKEASNDIIFGSEYPLYYIIVFENDIAIKAYEYHGLYIGG